MNVDMTGLIWTDQFDLVSKGWQVHTYRVDPPRSGEDLRSLRGQTLRTPDGSEHTIEAVELFALPLHMKQQVVGLAVKSPRG